VQMSLSFVIILIKFVQVIATDGVVSLEILGFVDVFKKIRFPSSSQPRLVLTEV